MWQTYTGDGSKGPFTFTFGASNVNQILCIVSTGYGDMTLNGADFSVTLNKDQDNNPGGIVTLDQVLPIGHYLTVGLVGQIVQTPNSVERRKGARSDVVCRHLKSIEDQYRESVFKTEKIYTDCADKLDDFTESEKKVITDKLDKVNSDIDSMKTESEGRLSALETSVTNTENNINQQIENTKANVDNKLLVIKQAIEVNGQNIQKNKENIAANDTAIKANLATIESHTKSLSSLDGRVTTNESDIDSLEERATTLESTTADHESRIKANEIELANHETRIADNETAKTNHETRITANEKQLTNHELRLNNIETSTDVGQFATRLQAIEDKNAEQEKKIQSNTNALADEQQAREQKDTSLETKNTEQDGRLDAIETKNTEQVTEINSHLKTIDAKNTEQDTNISNNTKAITDLSKSLIAKTSGLWADTETMHNNIYRGADLLSAGHFSSINDIITAISQGNFEDIFVGDYFTASYTVDGAQQSAKFRIAGINYFKAAANEWGVQDNHVCIVPDTLGSSVMNDTNVTTGGYIGSKMYTTVLPKYYAALAGSVGTPFYGHIKAMKESLVNGVDNTIQAGGGIAKWTGAATGWADIANISLCLLSELEIYGTRNFGTAGDNVKNAAQLPMFRLNPNTITVWGTKNTWLRSVASSAAFCLAGGGFHANNYYASYVFAVRPRFAIG